MNHISNLKNYLAVLLLLSVFTCSKLSNASMQEIEIRKMFNAYFYEINNHGLESESKYLSDRKDFFLIPPGYDQALTKPALMKTLGENQKRLDSVSFSWKHLEIFVLDKDIANYYGIVNGYARLTSKKENSVNLIESGTVIRENNKWKILTGHASVLEQAE